MPPRRPAARCRSTGVGFWPSLSAFGGGGSCGGGSAGVGSAWASPPADLAARVRGFAGWAGVAGGLPPSPAVGEVFARGRAFLRTTVDVALARFTRGFAGAGGGGSADATAGAGNFAPHDEQASLVPAPALVVRSVLHSGQATVRSVQAIGGDARAEARRPQGVKSV
jgi:hypothetical protein